MLSLILLLPRQKFPPTGLLWVFQNFLILKVIWTYCRKLENCKKNLRLFSLSRWWIYAYLEKWIVLREQFLLRKREIFRGLGWGKFGIEVTRNQPVQCYPEKDRQQRGKLVWLVAGKNWETRHVLVRVFRKNRINRKYIAFHNINE